MKKKNFIFKIFVCLVIIALPTTIKAATIYQYTGVDTSKKVYDYADLFSETEEKDLYDQITRIIDTHNTDVVIATIDNNPSATTQIFAENFYDDNDFGVGSDREGILLVIDMEEREYYLVTTGATMRIINDMRIENILDVMESDMKAGNYYDAAKSFLRKTNTYYNYHKYGPPYLWLGAVVGAVIFAFIRLNKEKKKLKMISDSLAANNYLVDSDIDYANDRLVDTRTRVIVHLSSSGGSGGGGGGGGGHGGGGRSF